MLPLQGAPVRCLVRELTSYMPSSVAKYCRLWPKIKKKKKKKLNFSEKKKDKKKEKKVRWGKGRNSWLEEHQKDLASMWDGSRKSETESKK